MYARIFFLAKATSDIDMSSDHQRSITVMRVRYIFIFLFFLFASCEKKQQQDLLPDWLEEIINERNQNGLCYYSSAMRYSWRGEYYYELFSFLSSCFRCDVFRETGERITWESYEVLEDYELNRQDEMIIWVCNE